MTKLQKICFTIATLALLTFFYFKGGIPIFRIMYADRIKICSILTPDEFFVCREIKYE